jgi:hypothetical protein
VRIALRGARSHGRCRRWAHGRLGRATRHCGPLWMRAAVTATGASAWRWSVRLGGRMRAGRYVVAARVSDRRGRVLLNSPTIRLRVR